MSRRLPYPIMAAIIFNKKVLLGISGDEVSLQMEEQIIAIAYGDILKARLSE